MKSITADRYNMAHLSRAVQALVDAQPSPTVEAADGTVWPNIPGVEFGDMDRVDEFWVSVSQANSAEPYVRAVYERFERQAVAMTLIMVQGDQAWADALVAAYGDSGEPMSWYISQWTRDQLVCEMGNPSMQEYVGAVMRCGADRTEVRRTMAEMGNEVTVPGVEVDITDMRSIVESIDDAPEDSVIDDATARTIASWYQLPGPIGSVLAAFASGRPVMYGAIADDIENTLHWLGKAGQRTPMDASALYALDWYMLANAQLTHDA